MCRDKTAVQAADQTMLTRSQPAAKRILIISLTILLILALAYAIIRPGREYGAAWYAQIFYRPSVSKTHNQTYKSLNSELERYGITFPIPNSTCLQGISDSGYARYHLWHLTVECSTDVESNNVAINDEKRSKWEQTAAALHATLALDGWVDGGNYSSPFRLQNLLEIPDDGYAINTAYSKKFGKYSCDLDFDATGASRLKVYESCTRNVSFFGGY